MIFLLSQSSKFHNVMGHVGLFSFIVLGTQWLHLSWRNVSFNLGNFY